MVEPSGKVASTWLKFIQMVVLPTLIVYFALQRYFIAGLTIGAEKG